jgi:hypothetical protein
MKLIYIAGPYRATCALKTQRNIFAAENLGKQLTLQCPNYYPVIPHMNTALWGYDAGLINVPGQYYLDGTMEMMRRCDGVLVVPNYLRSQGTIAEIAEAERLGIPVYYSVTQVPVNG